MNFVSYENAKELFSRVLSKLTKHISDVNLHIPSGGASGQILGWSADGTAIWIDPDANGTGYSSIIRDITIPVSSFVAQDDGTYPYLYTYESHLITDESMVDVCFSCESQPIGIKAGIYVDSEAGKILFKAKKLPTDTLVVSWIQIKLPSTDDLYVEDYTTEITELQQPTFEDYSSTAYSEDISTSLAKVKSQGFLGKILEGIKGSLINLNNRLTSCNNDLENNHKIIHYSSLEDLGLTVGSETIMDICETLPNHSCLSYSVGSSNAKIYPYQYGICNVERITEERVSFTFYKKQDSLENAPTALWIGFAYTLDSTWFWSGWHQLANASDYLPLTGGTLTGQILYLNNGTSRWISNGTATQLEQIDGGNTNNRTVLLLNSNATELNDAIKMFRVADGSISSYKLYGDHNRDNHIHSQNLKMNDGENTVTVMKCYADSDSTTNYGSNLLISGNGNTYIGSGESVTNLYSALGNNTSENMYICGDGSIIFMPNCNTIANRKPVYLSSSAFYPITSASHTLGTSTYKWGQIYSSASSISTSDKNQKHDIKELDSKSIEFILGLVPKSYKFNDGTSNRDHWGLIAQDVENLMSELNISSTEFAGFIKSPKEKIVNEATGELELDLDADGNIQYEYALRYEEFIAPLIKTVQEQQEEINMLKEELENLRALITEK